MQRTIYIQASFVSDFHDFWSSLSAQDVEQLLFFGAFPGGR